MAARIDSAESKVQFAMMTQDLPARAILWRHEIYGEGILAKTCHWSKSVRLLERSNSGSEVRNGTYANVRWVHAEPLASIRLPVIPDHCSCDPCFKEGYTGSSKVLCELCVAETCRARYLI